MKVEFDNTNGIIIAAMQGELGLRLESKKEVVEVLVIVTWKGLRKTDG
jgi:uncharacterized protein (TIGR03435 family)